MYRVVHVLIATTHDTRNSLFDIITTRGEEGERGATLTPGPSPALRGTLTPGPSPALRERGDLGYKCGIVERYRIAPAPLIPPSAPAAWERKGGWGGKVRVPLCLHHIIDRKG
jgi:hypothetical protein